MEQSHAVDVLSDLIAAIYDCAVDPSLWPNALSAMCREMAFRSAALNLRSFPSGNVLLLVTTGIGSPWLEMMYGYGPEMVEQWGGMSVLLSLPPDQPIMMSKVNSAGLTDSNRIYREWTSPRGIIDVMAVGLARDGAASGTIAFGRHRDAGPIGEREMSLARLLIPHLQRAVAISRLLDVGSVKAAMFESVVDALSVGVIVTDTKLRVVHANSVAEAMLEQGMPVRSSQGSFSIPSPGATAALATAVAKAASNEAELGRNGFGLPLRFGDGETHVFHVLPLRSGQLRPTVKIAGDAAIFIAPSRKSPLWPEVEIGSLFDLTPAEARVFEGIASGLSPAAIAARSGVAIGTIKTHLRQVFAKTGCHRQAELVGLAASLKLPVW